MPFNWFRRHRSCSDYDESTLSSPDAGSPKHKTKRTKQRMRRAYSQGQSLRYIMTLGGSRPHKFDAADACGVDGPCTRLMPPTSRRRFTIHGLSFYHKHIEEASWRGDSTPAGSPLSMYTSRSPSSTASRPFGFSSSRKSHDRSPQALQMVPDSGDSHPSIIFIDCPP